jgi:exopolyphosphatase/guanosine-5'-triphosphate,3'-diphosphate pyrophosphatase
MDRSGADTQLKVAAIDIGTNTCLMLIAEFDPNDGVKILADEHAIVRLGENVDKTRNISDEAYQRLAATLRRYAVIIQHFKVNRIEAVGTSALRDAINRDYIIAKLEREFGLRVEIISGTREAGLTYRGAMYGFDTTPEETAVIDIGGGSTEIAFGSLGVYGWGRSFDVGAVRLTERGITKSSLPDIQQMLAELFTGANETDWAHQTKLVAVAGTPTTLAAMRNKLSAFDRSKVHGEVLMRSEIESLLDEMLTVTTDELIVRYPAVPRGRADILPAGTVILIEAMKSLKMDEVTVSANGLRYGAALEMLFPLH